MKVSDAQMKVLNAIANSESMGCDGEEMIGTPVWTFCVVTNAADRAVLGHLRTAGLVTLGEHDGDETVALTAAGFALLP
jgi:hypothetical protein